MKNIELVGKIINNIEIVEYFCNYYNCHNLKKSRPYFKCKCFCGVIFSVRSENIKNSTTKSCGCLTSKLMSSSKLLPNNKGAINKFYNNYKQTASRRRLNFNLSLDEFIFIINDSCYYCGIEPSLRKFMGSNKKYKSLKCNGIDRIDNNIGYELNNCVSCCSFCNRAKSDNSLQEFQEWIKRLIKFNKVLS